MEWTVLFDEEFADWLDTLDEDLRIKIAARVELLERFGPNPGRPRVDSVKGSVFSNMKELRIKHRGEPWRILFASDPEQSAVLLVGGNKAGNKRWYDQQILIANQSFRRHLDRLN
jgi:hypothetical protein